MSDLLACVRICAVADGRARNSILKASHILIREAKLRGGPWYGCT